MSRAARIPHDDAPASYVDRIRHHIERDEVGAARRLVAEALRDDVNEPGLKQWAEVLAPAKILGSHPATGTDIRLDIRWFDEHRHEYKGQWVAVARGELLAHAESYEDLRAKLAASAPTEHPLVHFIQ
jgi:hypothetical protein